MVFKFFNVNNQSSVFVLELVSMANYEQQIIVEGFNPDKDNSSFFRREIFLPAKSRQRYFLTSPLTSKNVFILLFDLNNNNLFKASVVRYPMKVNFNFSKDTKDFLNFIIPFSYNYPEKPFGVYRDKTNKYELWNLPIIQNETGSEIATPSRISVKDSHIEVSHKMFYDIPIPRRIMILLHEYSHNFVNRDKDNESEADLNGANIYLKMNFPAIEAVYAFTNILKDNVESHTRLENLLNFLGEYNKNLNKYLNNDDNRQTYTTVFHNHNIGRL